MKGKVLWWNDAKGFGFIKGEDCNEYFAHFADIVCDGYKILHDGDLVEFDVCIRARGREAANIKKIIPIKEEESVQMKVKMRAVYKTNSNSERINLVHVLAKKGFTLGPNTVNGIFEEGDFEKYPFIILDNIKKVLTLCSTTSGYTEVTRKELLSCHDVVEVKLNDEYTAKLYEECMIVGCQKFSYDALKNLLCSAQGYLPEGIMRVVE